MGSKVSGQAGPPPEGAILDIMRRKYGDKALKYLNVWTAEFGFPVGGSLGLKNILLLEERLKKKELEMRKKKKISVKKLEIMEGQKECLQIWKGEADARNREIMQKQLPFTHERTETNEKQDLNTARTSDLQISSSLFPQLAEVLKLDPDLDGNPPSHPSDPPSYNSTREPDPFSMTQQEQFILMRLLNQKNSSDNHSSPIGHRLRHSNQDTAFNMPMIEFSGPEGTTWVFRAWTSADITAAELRRHAIHACDQLLQKKKKKEETTQKQRHMAAMTMYNTVQDNRQPHHERKQRIHSRYKNGENRFPRRFPNDVCYNCGQSGHFKRDCPALRSSVPENTSD